MQKNILFVIVWQKKSVQLKIDFTLEISALNLVPKEAFNFVVPISYGRRKEKQDWIDNFRTTE